MHAPMKAAMGHRANKVWEDVLLLAAEPEGLRVLWPANVGAPEEAKERTLQ